ncbi:tetratricopeptide repeat protein [Streptomyces cyslabdanicus]|uniref:tetratricopeptide repeat protein n=1 Tax=Streptomyces cyslabdanicus TaxID=1470456 RepID=UPI004043BC00
MRPQLCRETHEVHEFKEGEDRTEIACGSSSQLLGQAIPLLEATLAQCEQVLGDTHRQALVSRNNLAAAYASAGDLGRAIPLFEQTLTDRVRVLGEGHPDTLISRNNIANARQKRQRPSLHLKSRTRLIEQPENHQ